MITIDIDIDEAREMRDILKTVNASKVTHVRMSAPEFYADLKAAIDNYDEAAYDRQTEAYYGGDGAGQKHAAATAEACKDAGRENNGR